MNAIQLFAQYEGGLEPSGVWYCQKCRQVYPDQKAAEECCGIRICKCGCQVKPGWVSCQICQDADERERERQRFEKAEKITTWDGWVFCESFVSYNNGFFESVSELLEYCQGQDELPDYVWTCDPEQWVVADIDDIFSRLESNCPEDFDFQTLNGIDELTKALEAFMTANKDEMVYNVNYNRALVLSPSVPSCL